MVFLKFLLIIWEEGSNLKSESRIYTQVEILTGIVNTTIYK